MTERLYLPIGYLAARPRTGTVVHILQLNTSSLCLCDKTFSGMHRVGRRRADVTCTVCLRKLEILDVVLRIERSAQDSVLEKTT